MRTQYRPGPLALLPQCSRDPTIAHWVTGGAECHRAICPALASGQVAHLNPAGSRQTRPRLALLGVRDKSAISHRLCRAPRGTVEGAVRIGAAVRASPVHLSCQPIVKVASHWTTDHRY